MDGILAVVDGVRRRGSAGAGWEIGFGVVAVFAGLFVVIHRHAAKDSAPQS